MLFLKILFVVVIVAVMAYAIVSLVKRARATLYAKHGYGTGGGGPDIPRRGDGGTVSPSDGPKAT